MARTGALHSASPNSTILAMRFVNRLAALGMTLCIADARWASAADCTRAPANRPVAPSVHTHVAGHVVTRPGTELEQATIILRDGRIAAVAADAQVPAEARVHDMTGTTIYAGFIDAHVSFAK